MSTRIDLISKLPIDITWNIFLYLTVDDLAQSLQTSLEWRNRILNCAKVWQNLVLDDESPAIAKVLPQVASFVQRFHVESRGPIINSLQLIKDGYFKKLTSISIEDTDMNEQLYLPAIQKVQGTLTELLISSKNLPPLEEILLSCPNLTRLAYCTTANIDIGMSTESWNDVSSRLKLTHLYLRIKGNISMDYQELELLLKHCPDIELLDIGQCERSPLDLINRYCSKLVNLTIDDCPNYEYYCRLSLGTPKTWYKTIDIQEQKIRSSSNVNYNNKTKNLQKVVLKLRPEQVDGVQMLSLLNDHGDELENLSIHLSGYDGMNPDPRWNPLLDFESDSLQRLTFDTHTYPNILASILHKCPNIHELKLNNLYSFSSDEIDAITNAPSLRHCHFLSRIHFTENNMNRFAMGLQKRGPDNGLDLLEFDGLDWMKDNMLEALTWIANLKGLKFVRCNKLTLFRFHVFLEELQTAMPVLEYICLQDMQNVNDITLHALGGIKSLLSIDLMALDDITDRGLLRLVSSPVAANLKQLVVFECSHLYLSKKTIDVCKAKVPNAILKKAILRSLWF